MLMAINIPDEILYANRNVLAYTLPKHTDAESVVVVQG